MRKHLCECLRTIWCPWKSPLAPLSDGFYIVFVRVIGWHAAIQNQNSADCIVTVYKFKTGEIRDSRLTPERGIMRRENGLDLVHVRPEAHKQAVRKRYENNQAGQTPREIPSPGQNSLPP